MRLSLAILLWLFSACIALADDFNYSDFSKLPVQHDGRIKPLETFALIHLQRFHGSTHLGDKPAIAWLAETMFDPAKALAEPLFLVKDTDAQSMLGLPAKPDNLYSFAEATEAVAANEKLIRSLLDIPPSELSVGQRAALDLYENTGLFTQITLACTLFLQLNIALPPEEIKRLGLDPHQPLSSFIDYYKYLPELKKSTHNQQAIERLSMTFASSQNNTLLRVIPPQWGSDVWLSPWAVFHLGQGSPEAANIMGAWHELARAYQAHDAAHWQQAVSTLRNMMNATSGVRPQALALEVLYHRFEPLGKSMDLYIAGFLLTLLCVSGFPLRVYALGVTLLGACLHVASIATRIYILERPPVGTLYESLLFVSLIAVLFGLFLEYRQRNRVGLLVATLAGSFLLLASQSFSGDDTMNMLIAVLNTNFWLATHVLCITTGYGFGIVAGIIAHIHLIMRCLRRDPDKTRQVLRGAYGTALIALLFTSLGTILGGIWADQSWGRFWGWDPKENGALLICLWLIWLLHGRISARLHELGFAIGLAMLTVVISLSWLGVNLLSTGLHSYGFTDKAAWSLGAFCAAEFSFAAAAYGILWRRDRETR